MSEGYCVRAMAALGFEHAETKVHSLPGGHGVYKGRVLTYLRAADR